MGCDIHIVLERRREGSNRWIGEFTSDNWVIGRNLYARQRDYGFFGRLAGVRSSPQGGPRHYPKNLPRDVSELAWDSYIQYPTDHHSVSHLSIEDFCAAFLAENPNHKHVREDSIMGDLLGVYKDSNCEYRVVFWFDN